MKVRRGLPVLLALIVVACVASGNAAAETIVKHDAQGRAINFDVQAVGVDVDWYAGLLRRAAHGDEISTVTIRIVTADEMHEECGRFAAGCYYGRRSPTLTIPAGKGRQIASIFLHEYGHHVDAAWDVDGAREPNGTPVWYALRGMAEFRENGAVVGDYRLGWNRGIGEIFAEDYAYIHVGGPYGIPWLYPPNARLKKALLAELRGERTTPPPAASANTMTRPVNINESGTLESGESHVTTFRLLGPGRRVTLTATLLGPNGSQYAGRAVVTCDGAVVREKLVAAGKPVTIDVPDLGPAECRASLVNTGSLPQRFSFRVRLAIQL